MAYSEAVEEVKALRITLADSDVPEYNSNVNIIKLSGEDDVVHLFAEFIPVTGLYIAGTYYLLEIVERKKDDRKRKNENA